MVSASTVRFQLLLSAAVAAFCTLPTRAVAQNLPQNGNFVEGSGSNSTSGTTMTVNLETTRSIINWDSFDVGDGYTVDFDGSYFGLAPGAVLNRVLLDDVSNINGSLTSDSNIQVLLVNQNGIIFGPTAEVNVGSLIASTLDIDNDDFFAGGVLDSQAPADPALYYFFDGDVDTGVTVEGGAQVNTNAGPLVLLGAFVDVQAGGSVSGFTDVGFVAGNLIKVPADPGSPLSFSIRASTPIENAITIGGQVSGRNVRAFMETDADAQNALLLVTDTGSITATRGGGGDIVLTMGARTSEGGITNSPGGIRNDGTLTATFDVVLQGGNGFSPRFAENNGIINVGDDVRMLARETVTNTGSITAVDDVTLSAFATSTFGAQVSEVNVTNSGDISAGGDVLLLAHLSVSGSAFSTETGLEGRVDITNSGTISAGGDVTLAASFSLSGFATDSAVDFSSVG